MKNVLQNVLSIISIIVTLSFHLVQSAEANPLSASGGEDKNLVGQLNPPKAEVVRQLGNLPAFFIENQGQTAEEVRYYFKGNDTVYFTDNGIVFQKVETTDKELGTKESVMESGDDIDGDLVSPADMPGENETPEPARAVAYRLDFLGANPTYADARRQMQGKINYLMGNDSSKWHADIPTYQEIVYPGLYEGTDLVYRGVQGGMKYEFVVQPGANPDVIKLAYTGIEGLSIDDAGNLIINTALGDVKDTKPYCYQEIDGKKVEVESNFKILNTQTKAGSIVQTNLAAGEILRCAFRDDMSVVNNANLRTNQKTETRNLKPENRKPKHIYGFELAPYNKNYPLIIDPGLKYSTYLGGAGNDSGQGIAVDSSGNAYVVGYTESDILPVYPPQPGPFQPVRAGGYDAFVVKLNADGSALVYGTYLGGSNDDFGYAIAVDASGNAHVTGQTYSSDFPVVVRLGTWEGTYHGSGDTFVAKLNPTGSGLEYSIYLEGSGRDCGKAIAIQEAPWISDSSFGVAVYVAGYTGSSDFWASNMVWTDGVEWALDTSYNGGESDAFVSLIHYGHTTYATFLGGSGQDEATGIALDASGYAYVTGMTTSSDFTGSEDSSLSFDSTFNGESDAFVVKLWPWVWDPLYNFTLGEAQLIYSTYLGGSGRDVGRGIAVDASDNAYVTGGTHSRYFPTTSTAFERYHPSWVHYTYGGEAAFVTKLNPTGSGLEYSTFLGGSNRDKGHAIAVDSSGCAHVIGGTSFVGGTWYGNFPTTPDAYDTSFNGYSDVFVTKLNPTGSGLEYSTYLGGSDFDGSDDGDFIDIDGQGIALDSLGSVYVTGATRSNDFPMENPLQPAYGGGSSDAFVTKLIISQNSPPQANAGNNISISTEDVAITTIQGTATDEDGDSLVYRWTEGGVPMSDWTSVVNGECSLVLSAFLLPEGSHTLILEVYDGTDISSDDMILTIDNSAPTVAASGAGTYQIGSDVTLGGTVSDFDGDTLSYEWLEGTDQLCYGDSVSTVAGGAPESLPVCINYFPSLGMHTYTVNVNDGTNAPVSADVIVEVIDTNAPTLAPIANKGILWPPNHQMVDVVITANAEDTSGYVTLSATVTSSEPEDGLGDGDMSPDWTEPVIDPVDGTISLQLRAERSGSEDGRVYTITITATDGSFNSSIATVECIVPHQ